jgi:hypothetical protein
MQSFISSKNLHFDNEQEIHMSSENHEESGYRHDLDHLTLIACCVLYPTRTGCREKSVHFKTWLPYKNWCWTDKKLKQIASKNDAQNN